MSSLPNAMVAAVLKSPGNIALEEIDVPSPSNGQVLVEVDFCGICGSDVHLLHDGWGKPGLIAGHEVTGTIVKIGESVSTWSDGDRVVIGPSPRCGKCRRCLQGKPSQCENREGQFADGNNGAFAHYIVAGTESLLHLPEGLSPRVAALAEPLAVALHGINRSGLEKGGTVMIFGAGPIGALSLAVLISRGFEGICVVEPSPGRAELAKQLGAVEVIHPSELESFDRFDPQGTSSRAVDVVLECSGKKAAMEAGLQQLSRGGMLCLVGAGIDHPTFDPNRVILNELSITGSFVYDDHGFDVALEILASGDLQTDLLIDPTDIPLSKLSGVLGELARGEITGKVMVNPSLEPIAQKEQL